MSTKRVRHTTKDGEMYDVLIPSNVPDRESVRGIRIGPPDLSGAGLPRSIEVALNNQLYSRKLFTFKDVQHRTSDVVAALMAAYRVDATTIISLYKEEGAAR